MNSKMKLLWAKYAGPCSRAFGHKQNWPDKFSNHCKVVWLLELPFEQLWPQAFIWCYAILEPIWFYLAAKKCVMCDFLLKCQSYSICNLQHFYICFIGMMLRLLTYKGCSNEFHKHFRSEIFSFIIFITLHSIKNFPTYCLITYLCLIIVYYSYINVDKSRRTLDPLVQCTI